MDYIKSKLVQWLPASWLKVFGLTPKKSCCKGKSSCKSKKVK